MPEMTRQGGSVLAPYDTLIRGVAHLDFCVNAGRILAYDHKHRHSSDKGVPYAFQDAHQLLTDFLADVDSVLQEMRREDRHVRPIAKAIEFRIVAA